MLLVHFLSDAVHNGGPGMPKTMPRVSRGALVKLMEYNWPGNVRELKNCVTNALTFCEGRVLLAEDIRIGAEVGAPVKNPNGPQHTAMPDIHFQEPAPPPQGDEAGAKRAAGDAVAGIAPSDFLNHRQRRVLPLIVARGSVSRHEYQTMVEGDISVRTALYDLHTFVETGILRKEGRGPALRYVVVRKDPEPSPGLSRSAAA
jgi:DNA-binding NtrC family response regulator